MKFFLKDIEGEDEEEEEEEEGNKKKKQNIFNNGTLLKDYPDFQKKLVELTKIKKYELAYRATRDGFSSNTVLKFFINISFTTFVIIKDQL
jgi:hypothetical protein